MTFPSLIHLNSDNPVSCTLQYYIPNAPHARLSIIAYDISRSSHAPPSPSYFPDTEKIPAVTMQNSRSKPVCSTRSETGTCRRRTKTASTKIEKSSSASDNERLG